MNERERFLGIARSELKGELFLPFNLNIEWFMEETIKRWEKEGLPPKADLLKFFGLNRIELLGWAPYDPVPPFEEEILWEEENLVVMRDYMGRTVKTFKEYARSKMPQWLDFPIKTRKDFAEFSKRFNPHSKERAPKNWENLKKHLQMRDFPLGIAAGSFFGHTLQQWIGTENVCMLFYDDPKFIHEILDYLEYFFFELIKDPVREIQFDFASFGEDIAYKGRAFISPRLFKEFIQPHYFRICRYLREHNVEVIFVDSDGYIDELIPLWMEAGINGFSPLEVAAGEDALALKKKYGKNIVLVGNIDKRALIKGKSEIDKEVAKVEALLQQGGYFPSVDHSVPPDVPFENFVYLLQRLKELS